MLSFLAAAVSLFSVLFPARLWFAPSQPITVSIKAGTDVTLVLTDFAGKQLDGTGADIPTGNKDGVDLKPIFPSLGSTGTFLLYAVPKGKSLPAFVGTPLVIRSVGDTRAGAPPGPMVYHIAPLSYALMTTDAGPVTMAFYYDVAPNTVASFLSLASEGYFDGLSFHRIVPSFVIQGGDPRGDGTGGPGYLVNEEFNDRPHLPGVLSMARSSDPNSAGSQFFICLDYSNTKQLDHQYTAFGIVTSGMDAVNKIAATPLADPQSGRPATPQVIKKIEVFPVTPEHDPYVGLAAKEEPASH